MRKEPEIFNRLYFTYQQEIFNNWDHDLYILAKSKKTPNEEEEKRIKDFEEKLKKMEYFFLIIKKVRDVISLDNDMKDDILELVEGMLPEDFLKKYSDAKR